MYRSPAPSLPHSSSYRSPSPLTPSGGGGGGGAAEDDGILAQLDAVAPLRSFDGPPFVFLTRPQSLRAACPDELSRSLRPTAFPKVQASYTSKSTRGGLITAAVCWTIFLLVLNDLGEYLYGDLRESFRVDGGIAKEMQLNVDLVSCFAAAAPGRKARRERADLDRAVVLRPRRSPCLATVSSSPPAPARALLSMAADAS